MNKFSIGDVDKPTHATVVNGFHKHIRAAISPEASASGGNINIALHEPVNERREEEKICF